MQRLRLSPFLLAGGVSLALAGCGASPSALQSVGAAARTTLAQGIELTLTLHGASLSGTPAGTVLGAAAFALPRGEGLEAVDLPAGAGGSAPRAHLVFLPDGVEVAPALTALLPPGRSWIDAPLAGPGAVPVPGLAALLEGLNPQLLLDEVAWGAVSASALGQQVIAHVPYSRYRVVVDLAKALTGARGPAADAMRAALRDELAAGAARVRTHGLGRRPRPPRPPAGAGSGLRARDGRDGALELRGDRPAEPAARLRARRARRTRARPAPVVRAQRPALSERGQSSPTCSIRCAACWSLPIALTERRVWAICASGGSAAFAPMPGRAGYSKSSLPAMTFWPAALTRKATNRSASARWELEASTAAPEMFVTEPGSSPGK